MLSFKVEYALRILVEMQTRKLAGITQVPAEWLKRTCGNDASGMSIVLRILRNLEWVNYESGTYLYSINSEKVNINELSLHDLCLNMNDGSKSIAKSLKNDNFSKSLEKLFKDVKLSNFINQVGEERKLEKEKSKPKKVTSAIK